MKMIYRKLSKTASLPSPVIRAELFSATTFSYSASMDCWIMLRVLALTGRCRLSAFLAGNETKSPVRTFNDTDFPDH
jgi:hypothetical protein